jgi:DNA-binding NtrC family response regulator
VGDNTTVKVEVRIIAATNQPLSEMIKKRTFREDLYYRLSVIPIEVPPLRERKEDIPLLVSHFLKTSQVRRADQEIRIAPEALDILSEYSWPGNVRELQNVIERAIVLCDGRLIRLDDLPTKLRETPSGPISQGISKVDTNVLPPLGDIIAQVEKEYCTAVLKRFDGDKKKAAEMLKISVPAIYRKLKASPRPSSIKDLKDLSDKL